MRDVWVRGAAMTHFSKHGDRTARDMVEEVVAAALRDAEVDAREVQAAHVGNSAAGLFTGQESIRGQVVLRHTGLMGVPIVNCENACASSSTALHLGWQAVASGRRDCVVVVGYEKIDGRNANRVIQAINATMDLDELASMWGPTAAERRNVYGEGIGASFRGDGSDPFGLETLALVSVKNHHHSSLNPCARFHDEVTLEQVLTAPPVGSLLTKLMCAALSDGAACLVLCAGDFHRCRSGGARIAASVLTSGRGDDMRRPFAAGLAARQAYDIAGLGPEDLDLVELYDANAASELTLYTELGLCAPGDAARLVEQRETWLGGRLPVNPSGGLLGRGHPPGATGAAQVAELMWQLEGRCGARQVPSARVAMAEITGGWLGTDVAACCIHVLRV
jgi:acetyl-CoA acetyltransferase